MDHHDDEKTKPIHTRVGTSDGIVGNGEKMTGRSGEEVQDEASDFYEEIGAIITGQEGEDIHTPDMEGDES